MISDTGIPLYFKELCGFFVYEIVVMDGRNDIFYGKFDILLML